MLPDAWYRAVCRAAVALHYRRVHVVGAEHLPHRDRGPVLYVGLHRNGAVDGMVCKTVLPGATFLVAARLLRAPLGRLFFTGIPVERAADVAPASDSSARAAAAAASLDACVAHLARGGELFVFPEGTSDLGPRHLPFHRGAARVMAAAAGRGAPLTVVPVAIFYRAPERVRSDVVVVAGAPLALDALPSAPGERVAECHRRITASLEALAVEAESDAALARLERRAAVAADGDLDAYYPALRALADGRAPLSQTAERDWSAVEHGVTSGALATEFGAPVFSRRCALWSVAWLAVQAPVVAGAAIANVVPLAAAEIAARRLADARNTVALWRILVGLPLLALWALAIVATSLAAGHPWIAAGYAAVTAAGVALHHELLARWARLVNAVRAPALRAPLARVRRHLRRAVRDADRLAPDDGGVALARDGAVAIAAAARADLRPPTAHPPLHV